MSGSAQTLLAVMPSASPSEAEIAAWGELPREEQARRLRAWLSHPDCTTPSFATAEEILERAEAAAKLRNV